MSIITISLNGTWAGIGTLTDGIVTDCAAQFCDDNDRSLAVYDEIEEAIESGKQSITVAGIGTVSWEII